MSALKVFLSHTSKLARLPAGRSFVQAALDAAVAAGVLPGDMRYFTADDRSPAQRCEDAVRACDVYVGLFGLDYGSPVRNRPEVSYTELEFLTALEEKQRHGMRVFVFLLDDKAEGELGPLDDRQRAFRQRVLDSGLTAASFSNPDALAYLLHRTLTEQLPAAPSANRPMQHSDKRERNFTGRTIDLEEAERQVRSTVVAGGALCFVGFKGMGGVGKTTLAAELAQRLAEDGRLFPGGVLWSNLLEEAPEDAARRWVRDLGGDIQDLSPEACIRRFHELAAARRPLVVLDNVPRVERSDGPAARLLVRAKGVATLLTTRFREAIPTGVVLRELDVLPPNEAFDLLRVHAPAEVEANPAAARNVVEGCGRLPLFLNAAGRAMANGYYSLAERLSGKEFQ
jgi:hypothetical protein